jgi:hypothetical protein
MGDDFTRHKWLWLDQVLADSGAAPAFRLAYVLASRFLNRGTGDAFPSQETLGAAIGLTTANGVRYLVDKLFSRGHLEVAVAHGRGCTNRYRLILKQADVPAATALFPDEPPTSSPADTNNGSISTSAISVAFDEWWRQYPKHVAKAAAHRAYERILRKGDATPEQLLAGALRYAGERLDQEPRFTKHATTWLNGGCWSDETTAPSVPREGARAQGAPPSSWLRLAMEGGLDGDE